jgi:hypothetical protein
MSKKKRAPASPSNRGVLRLFNMMNLALPKELQGPKLADISSLNALKTRFNELDEQLTKLKAQLRVPRQPESAPVVNEKILASIATNIWRAKGKMLDPETGEAKEEMKRVYRHIEAIFDALKELGVETIDQTGRAYDLGMMLNVVSFEQTPGLAKEEIKETFKPSVTWQGRLIQKGEVIVGTPQTTKLAKGESI